MNIAIALAFLMTIITASSNIVLKKGFHKIPPFVAVYFSVVISTIFLWIMTIIFVPKSNFSNNRGILVFVVIGSFAPAAVRSLTYYGIHKLGAGRSATMRSMTPFFATIMAVAFFGEIFKPGIFLGILLIVSGVTFLVKKEENDLTHWRFFHFIYPLGAAILAGFAANLRKYGLNILPEPIFASAIAATSSLTILTFYAFIKYSREVFLVLNHLRELKFILIAALLTSFGEIVDLSALLYGKVSLVVPIFTITPLIIVLLSKIFLKEHEMVNKKVILAAVFISAGVYFTITNAL